MRLIIGLGLLFCFLSDFASASNHKVGMNSAQIQNTIAPLCRYDEPGGEIIPDRFATKIHLGRVIAVKP
jgi:hypothetical protein